MAREPLSSFVAQLRRVVAPSGVGGLADRDLLERWHTQGDEAAFEVLLWRHGPMVLNVCRRILGDASDVEDAFQATFLILVRKAGSVRKGEAVAGWLYRVAYRVALKARVEVGRRSDREQDGVEYLAGEPDDALLWRDLRPVLDEEVQRLPDRYRTTFVLCYLQGRTNEEAARELGCPLGTVLSRLAWARERLRNRLTRRGLTLSAGLLVSGCFADPAAAELSASVVDTTLKAAALYASGQSVATGVISAPAVALTEGVLRQMFMAKMKVVTAVVMVLTVVVAGGSTASYWGFSGAVAGPIEEKKAIPPQRVAQDRSRIVRLPARYDGILFVIGTEIKEGEKVPKGRIVTLKVGEVEKKFRRLEVGDRVEDGQLLASLDNRIAQGDLNIAMRKAAAAREEYKASVAHFEEAKVRVKAEEDLLRKGAGSKQDWRTAVMVMDRYAAESVSKNEAIALAALEVEKARLMLEMQEIRSPGSGTITRIHKHRGEAVRALETVIEVLMDEQRD